MAHFTVKLLGQIKQRRHKIVCSFMNIKSQDLRHRSTLLWNRWHIQGITLLGPHTIEIAHDPDQTITMTLVILVGWRIMIIMKSLACL